ncbi:MAG: hypothetical protein KAT65_07200 [Methanophagales archaeon]|nr:hypothetical protein [Methanophagales archaeon]
MKKTKTIELISVVVIAMALALAIAFSGSAVASQPVKTTKETETIDITTTIVCTGTVVESQRLSLEIDSGNLLNNPPLNPDATYKKCTGEIYGKIKYGEKMIGSSGVTDFEKCLGVDTGTAPNLDVHKQIGYTQGFLGSLSHEEQLGMKVLATNWICTDKKSESVLPPEEEEWKKKLCPFKKVTTTTEKVPASCEEVHVYSEMVVTDVVATTETSVGITEAPVNLKYKICAKGTGLVVAGVSAYVEDGRGVDLLSSRMAYKEKSIGYGESVEFTKDIGYKSVISP